MNITKEIETIHNYPDTGDHQQCAIYLNGTIELPFEIRKGEDIYWYTDKNGDEAVYNNHKTKIDKRWIVNLIEDESNKSLKEIFHIEVSISLDKIINYCLKTYKKSLLLEKERIIKELELLQ